ncbi:hypothetical protein ACRAWC_01690 [Leifsonia sp. L25]|uniref:hypothetical protein n=1 Tax=Actinomycetes TaxID=1760 RepID=UPI003D699606
MTDITLDYTQELERFEHLQKQQNSAFALQRIMTALSTLQASGLTVLVDGEAKGFGITPESEISVVLGTDGKFPFGPESQPHYLIALTTPAPESADAIAYEDTAARLSCNKLVGRIAGGWVETAPDKRQVHVLAVQADTDEEFETVMGLLPADIALNNGRAIVTLDFTGHQPVAPTTGFVNMDNMGSPRVLNENELFGLGVVLDELSDTKTSPQNFPYDVRKHDTGVNMIRDSYNRAATVEGVQTLLEENGWEATGSDDHSLSFKRGSEFGRLTRSTCVLAVCDEAQLNEHGEADFYLRTLHTPFDLLVGSEQGGSVLQSSEDAAQWLSDNGHFQAETVVFSARGEKAIINKNQPTEEVIRQYTNAARKAKSKTNPKQPLLFAKRTPGDTEVEAIIGITPSGNVIRFNERTTFKTAMTAYAQYAIVKEDKDTGKEYVASYLHGGPDELVDAIIRNLKEDGQLSPVEWIARQPMVVSHRRGHGEVVIEPGYNPSAKAYLAIPSRQVNYWREQYEVPGRPTLRQAIDAYQYLYTEVLSDFPFVEARDGARAMAYILTACGRNLLNGSIGFLFNATTRGSGKSFLAMLGRLIAQGTTVAQTFSFDERTDQETKNAIVSLMVEGGTFLHDDEVAMGSTMRSKVIQAMIPEVDGGIGMRILGGNDTVKRKGIIVTACGNNVTTGSDLNRRFMTIRLDYPGAGPLAVDNSTRRHPNLLEWVVENRPKLLAAAHTILLYGLQNAPTRVIPDVKLNHNWAQIILGSLTHIPSPEGEGSVADLIFDGWVDELNASDENGSAWGEILCHLWNEAGTKPVLAKTLARLTECVSAHRAQHGIRHPEVPDDLRPWRANDPGAGKTFAAKTRKIVGTSIPYEGNTYKLLQQKKPKGDTNPTKYYLECYGPDNRLIPNPEGFPVHTLKDAR